MAFDVAADAYDRFMGRYSTLLAPELLAAVGPEPGDRALDVGCGPGVLTRHLVELLGADHVAAADPSPPFVAAARERLPGVDVRQAPAEQLPFDDDSFDVVLAQLVVPFMSDAVAGLREMARVARPGAPVAATAWDHASGGSGPLSPFWRVVTEFDPGAYDESGLAGQRSGDLVAIFREAGLADVRQLALTVHLPHATFEEWWEPYTWGVGPAGDYVASLDDAGRERLAATARRLLGDGPITISGTAWCAVGRA
ncbi:class I SAM-dependent methyltransferase [Nocardioides mangrovi]|uniref:Class I SAM-dependent methyltransferase n=1 Tax=Nocardioides mangrovi TaxID=2874580 RepID=A0ABS7UD68_9ACTN|nr:class I SAM-dependent methyltransferase [Nocardioides mangrovi]MBZ5738948.1 class I SAM-dependent methyltransferase [Nocardioides mangrovi]